MSVRAVTCCGVSVGVRSLLELESSVSIAPLLLYSTHHQPPTAAVVFVLVWFSSFSDICTFRYSQMFDFKYCFVIRVLFPEELDRD